MLEVVMYYNGGLVHAGVESSGESIQLNTALQK